MSSTEWKGYRAPGMRNIDDYSLYEDHLTTFIKNTGLRFLQTAFSQRRAENFRYDDNEELTELKIADQYAFQLEAAEKKPAIIAVRGSLNWSNIGINEGMQELNMRTGEEGQTDIVTGSVAFTCLSRVGLEAERLASDVFSLFKFFRRTLRKHGFFSIRSMSIGPEQLVEAPGEPKLFLVSVLMTCQVQDKWVLEPKAAAQLKKVVIQNLIQTPKPTDEELVSEIKIELENDDEQEGGS